MVWALVEEEIRDNWIACGVHLQFSAFWEKSVSKKQTLNFCRAPVWVLRWSYSSQDLPSTVTFSGQLLKTVPHPNHWLPVAQYSAGPDGQDHFKRTQVYLPSVRPTPHLQKTNISLGLIKHWKCKSFWALLPPHSASQQDTLAILSNWDILLIRY